MFAATSRVVDAAPPPLTPPHKGEGGAEVGLPSLGKVAIAAGSPSPLWGGVRGGGNLTHRTRGDAQ